MDLDERLSILSGFGISVSESMKQQIAGLDDSTFDFMVTQFDKADLAVKTASAEAIENTIRIPRIILVGDEPTLPLFVIEDTLNSRKNGHSKG